MNSITTKEITIGIVGLGYVGLPLALEFGKLYRTVGYDLDVTIITELVSGYDRKLEINASHFQASHLLNFCYSSNDLAQCTVFIVTVPTPIDEFNTPDLSPLISATQTIARILKEGDCVIYESTVYPGATEEVCVPILEELSGLKLNDTFFVGYSPERINLGDKGHCLTEVIKVTAGSCPYATDLVDGLYRSIIQAGTHKAPDIRTAEASKILENIQRDVNIALVNEMAMLFDKMNIDVRDVLAAARTKWNFSDYTPGLVGGHCISVDPYYLIHKSREVGFHPQLIESARRINDSMPAFIANRFVRQMINKKIDMTAGRILVLGGAFKPNCCDVRNSLVFDVLAELSKYGATIDLYDPWIFKHYDDSGKTFRIVESLSTNHYDGLLLAVNHDVFFEDGEFLHFDAVKPLGVIFDLSGKINPQRLDARL